MPNITSVHTPEQPLSIVASAALDLGPQYGRGHGVAGISKDGFGGVSEGHGTDHQ